jgi:UPF0716 protein FxsA
MLLLLVLIAVPAAEVFAFIEVGHAIGWLLAVIVLLGTSVLGAQLLRIQGRSALQRLSTALSERRAPAQAALDGALGFLGAGLLVIPGFITDALGALLVLPPTRALVRRWMSRRYASRVVRFAATAGRFAPGGRPIRPADIDSTAIEEDDPGQLPR